MLWKTRCTIQALAIALCATAASAQDNRGTPEQRAACTPDAFRLCAGYIPDAAGVELCLRQNRAALTDACRSVFEQSDGSFTSSGLQGGSPRRPMISSQAWR